LLALNNFLETTTVDLIAVLDDDLIFQNALLKRDHAGELCVTFETTHDYLLGLETIYNLSKDGPIIGGSTGCPPTPGASAIRCAIEDIDNSVNALSSTELLVAQEADYFYDFREHSDSDVSKGAWLSYRYNEEIVSPSFSNVLFGITPSRPLIFDSGRLLRGQEPSTRKGGNTYFGDPHHLLSIPHLSLCVDGLSTRRSDMIVAETAKQRGIIYRKTYFPLGHLRIANTAAGHGLSMLRTTEAELFGAALQRGITSFIGGGGHVDAWKDIFARRLNQILETYSFMDRATIHSDNRRELIELVGGFDCKLIYQRVRTNEEQFFQKYVKLVEQYFAIDHYWTTLMGKHDYQVDY
jgi:hypothetical protein